MAFRFTRQGVPLVFALALAIGLSVSARAACVGNCGSSSSADGVVSLPPVGTTYNWISTYNGVSGAGQLGASGGTNGSVFTTSTFSANAGDVLQYYFNYVTSDGSTTYPDYAWAQLQTSGGTPVALLLTAQTKPSGSIIPAPGLPATAAGVTLTPASVPIIPGAPDWSPLGISSGGCWLGPTQGCGYTGWVKSDYALAASGLYQLAFGVTNFEDTLYDSGLAFAGAKIGETPIQVSAVPLPAALPLFVTGLSALGLFGWRRKKKNAVALAA